jgi:ribosomal protein S12 methylthiotransferase
LANKGVKEIILIAQDLSYYGKDKSKKSELLNLIQSLSDIEGIQWIRLHYTFPSGFPKEVIREMKHNPKLCHYLDIPFQHISDKMLKIMRRGITKKQTYNLIDFFRKEIPDITLRTTLLTGHPGETEKDFNELLTFVKDVQFDRLGTFAYSHEEDTHSFKHYKDSISNKLKMERVNTLMQIQQNISYTLNDKKVGKTYKTMIDRQEGEYYIGRTEADSPEVDNEVLIEKTNIDLISGIFYNITINKSEEFDLYGSVCTL